MVQSSLACHSWHVWTGRWTGMGRFDWVCLSGCLETKGFLWSLFLLFYNLSAQRADFHNKTSVATSIFWWWWWWWWCASLSMCPSILLCHPFLSLVPQDGHNLRNIGLHSGLRWINLKKASGVQNTRKLNYSDPCGDCSVRAASLTTQRTHLLASLFDHCCVWFHHIITTPLPPPPHTHKKKTPLQRL